MKLEKWFVRMSLGRLGERAVTVKCSLESCCMSASGLIKINESKNV